MPATVTVAFKATRDVDIQDVIEQVARGLVEGYDTPPAPASATPAEAPRPVAYHWTKPDLHAKAMKSVHRVILATSDPAAKA